MTGHIRLRLARALRRLGIDLLIAAAVLGAAAGPAHAGIVRICADVWCPYNCGETGERPGYAVEIARKAFAPDQVEYHVVDWGRCLKLVAAGKMDGAIGMLPEEAPDLSHGTEPIGRSGDVFVTRADSTWTYDGPKSLDGQAIGLVAGYGYTDEITAFAEKNKGNPRRIQMLHGDDATEGNLSKLLAGRIDASIFDENVIRYAASVKGASDRIRIAGAFAKEDIYIGFSPNDPGRARLPARLDAGIKTLRSDGELAAILARYGIVDWRVSAAK